MQITIIGAGIGGLTTAIALKQKGFEVEVFEAASVFKKAGSGINLAINAMQIYQQLGLYDEILEAGNYTNSMVISNKNLKVLSNIDLKDFEVKFGAKTVAIHRAVLHEILLKNLKNTPVHLGKKLKLLQQSSENIELTFEDGSTHNTKVLIGADGIHSVVRKAIFDNTQIRSAKQICWRGITKSKAAVDFQTALHELWGKGKRFGFVPINKDEVYWYALANFKKDYRTEFEGVDLIRLFSDFHPTVTKLIKGTPKENILSNEIADLLPINTWHKGNICLLGDAAHATTPNMGQGACQAIESAMILSNCLAKEDDVQKAFSRYQNTRKKKVLLVIKNSWKIGKLAQTDSFILAKIRDFITPLVPESLGKKQSMEILKLES